MRSINTRHNSVLLHSSSYIDCIAPYIINKFLYSNDSCHYFPRVDTNANFESFIAQFLSPKVMRDFRLFAILDDDKDPKLKISAIHDETGYRLRPDDNMVGHTGFLIFARHIIDPVDPSRWLSRDRKRYAARTQAAATIRKEEERRVEERAAGGLKYPPMNLPD